MSSKTYHVGAIIGGITPIIRIRISLISRTSGRSVETFKLSIATSVTGKPWKAEYFHMNVSRQRVKEKLQSCVNAVTCITLGHTFLSNRKLTVN